ncbi:hypothetical protein [Bacteriovorax sp. DB6_IX]|uniref:hypothetical protein n=1 Tax=Bacteriovorax sp. DB6_IX TaxID=1353530 RepID=UPI000552B9B9|nr:hypothetical protein [Bacteriovorax sp. DB6_IX]
MKLELVSGEGHNMRLLSYGPIDDIAPWQDISMEVLKVMENSPKCQLMSRDLFLLFDESENKYHVARSFTGNVTHLDTPFHVIDTVRDTLYSLPIELETLYNNQKLLSQVKEFKAALSEKSHKAHKILIKLTPSHSTLEVRMENYLPFE